MLKGVKKQKRYCLTKHGSMEAGRQGIYNPANCELRTANCELRTANCEPGTDSIFQLQGRDDIIGKLECGIYEGYAGRKLTGEAGGLMARDKYLFIRIAG